MENYNLDDSVSVSEGNVGSRKKSKKQTKRDLAKKNRYTASGLGIFIPCTIKHNSNKFKCSEIRPADVKLFREKLYLVPDKIVQDNFIALHVQPNAVKRRRPSNKLDTKIKGKPHECSGSFFLNNIHGKRMLVCQKLFLTVAKIGAYRLKSILKKVNSSVPIKENRGGDKVSWKSTGKKDSIREFIKKLRGCESHYGRNKSKRLYLHADLNIDKLLKLYNSSVDETLRVKRTMFRRIFNNEFNLGFKSPASDVCTKCALLGQKLKKVVRGSNEEKSLMIEKRIHKLRARAFYELLRQPDDNETITYVFDLQQIQPLPKLPIQEAFYSRQLNFYSLCIVDQKGQHPYFYVWTENLAGKGSTEISNALLHFFNHSEAHRNKKNLRLFSDGCVSQNKNNINVQMLLQFLLQNQTGLKFITMFFPVRGHSFLPADRIFGRVEKTLRKKATIFSQDEYINVYKQFGVVNKLGVDWYLYDTKSLKNLYKPLQNISSIKRIILKKIKTKAGHYSVSYKGLLNFRYEDDNEKFISPFKRGSNSKNAMNFTMKELPLSHPISREKIRDVKKLMSLNFGEEWETMNEDFLEWYRSVLSIETEVLQESEDELCDCLCEETAVHI